MGGTLGRQLFRASRQAIPSGGTRENFLAYRRQHTLRRGPSTPPDLRLSRRSNSAEDDNTCKMANTESRVLFPLECPLEQRRGDAQRDRRENRQLNNIR